MSRVESSDLHQILNQIAKACDVFDEHLSRTARILWDVFEMVLQHRSFADKRTHGSSQLVGDVGGKSSLPAACLLELVDLFLQGLRHLVEGHGPNAEFVLAFDGEPCVKQSFSQRASRTARLGNRTKDSSRYEDSSGPGGDNNTDPAREEHVAELCHRSLDATFWEEEIRSRVRPAHLST